MFVSVPQDIFFYVSAGALALSFAAVVLAALLFFRVKRLMRGKNGADLEETIKELSQRAKSFETFRKELETYLQEADARIARSIQGVATVRFNPFQGEGLGGNQSFATALLDEGGNGVVISTLYTRERVSVFGKPVAKGVSSYELTDEEREAITQATLKPHKGR